VYRQISGEAMDLSEFSSHHAILARQLYPLLQQELRGLLLKIGLARLNIPFDLTPKVNELEGPSVDYSHKVH